MVNSTNLEEKFEEWFNNSEKVGNVYNVRGSYYGLDNIPITITKGKEIPNWSYVFVKHWKTGNPVVFQIINVHFDQPGVEYQDASISMGSPIKDPSMRKYKCRGLLVGEIEKDGKIVPPRYPIEPEADVYLCPNEMVEFVTQPLDDWSIKVGEIPELGIPVKIRLEPLVRQGLLITGTQGTGKTTALITLITRAALADPPLRFLILDWTGEFKSVDELIEKIKKMVDRKDFEPLSEILGVQGDKLKRKEYLALLKSSSVKIIEWWRIYCGFIGEELIQYLKSMLDRVISFQHRFSDAARRYTKELVYHAEKLTVDELEVLADERSGRRDSSTVLSAKVIITSILSSYIPRNNDEFDAWRENSYLIDNLKDDIRMNNVVIIDFSASLPDWLNIADDVDIKSDIATIIARRIWDIGSRDSNFGCVIVIDEAHRVCPEKDFGYMDLIWQRLASEGGRNKIPLWIVARRLSLVSKKVTTELQQNFFCFNVEDVDRARVQEDLGKSFADIVPYGTLPPLHCIIKSTGFRIPGQVIFTKIDVIGRPAGVKLSRDVFEEMKKCKKVEIEVESERTDVKEKKSKAERKIPTLNSFI